MTEMGTFRSIGSRRTRRRDFFYTAAGALAVLGARSVSAAQVVARQGIPERVRGVRAITFDVFGTVVDWRSSIIAEGRELGRRRGLDVDWEIFADRWRAG